MTNDDESVPRVIGVVAAEPFDARFKGDALWSGAWLRAQPDEVQRRVAEAHLDVEQENAGQLNLTRWLVSRSVHGPKLRTSLLHLIRRVCEEFHGRSVEDIDRGFMTLRERLRGLRVSTSSRPNSGVALGELVPSEYLLRKGEAVQTLRLASTPPSSLDIVDPLTDIWLLSPLEDGADEPAFKGCSPCRPDANSSLGGSKYCIRPGFEGLVECVWPPPEPEPLPEPTWEYWIQVGNSWWTTLFAVWHGSAYTRTIKRTPSGSLSVPWTVPYISAWVSPSHSPLGESYCRTGPPIGAESGSDSEEPGSEVSTSMTDVWPIPFPIPPGWGVMSSHVGGGTSARYCGGTWSWS